MPTYRVRHEIDVEADSAEEAAQLAFEDLCDGDDGFAFEVLENPPAWEPASGWVTVDVN